MMHMSTEIEGQPLLLRATEVAQLLGLGRSKVYEMMNAGELPVTRIGAAVRVPRDELLKWIKRKTTSAVTEEEVV